MEAEDFHDIEYEPHQDLLDRAIGPFMAIVGLITAGTIGTIVLGAYLLWK